MSSSRRIVIYSILRVLLFAVPFVIFMLLGIWWWVSALTAAVIAACVSFLFLTKQRNDVATVVQSWGKGTKRDSDNDLENAALDRNANTHIDNG
ncbi:MAG: DUF4229 domain-containing protein [Terrimesophilobacter sp.]